MSFRDEIEKSLVIENNDVDAVEDDLMKDSVLAIASSDFKEQDVLDVSLPRKKRPAVDLEVDYPGKPVSRKKYKRDNTLNRAVDEDDTDKSDDGDEEEDSDSGNEESLNDDTEEANDSESDDAVDDNEIGDEEDSDVDDEESLSDNESDDAVGDIGSHGADSPAVNDNESPVKLFSSKQPSSIDIQKGLALKEQLRIWETLLECRIKIEPGMVAANQLYQLEKMSEFISNEKSTGSSSVDSALNAIHTLSLALNKLQTLLDRLGDDELNNERIDGEGDDESIRSSELSSASDNEDVEQEVTPKEPLKKEDSSQPPSKITPKIRTLKQSYSDFGALRDSELEKWNEKAKISSGRAAQRDFSAFDQSILKVIESILSDKHRLIKKTQLKRADYTIYGKSKVLENTEIKDNAEIEGVTQNNNRSEAVYDAEIFNDGDFYHKLLRDFIESKSNDGKNEKKLVELHKLRIKMKRKVDTKATKGRKLRYVVHQKLVNYMAPVPSNNFSEEAERQLLRSLFGQTVSQSVNGTSDVS